MPTNSLKATRFTRLTVAPHEKSNQIFSPVAPAIFTLIDVQSLTLPAASNVAASGATEIAIAIPGLLVTDFVIVQPAAALIANLNIGFAYVLVAGTLRIRFTNSTAAIIDAGGVYNYLLIRR